MENTTQSFRGEKSSSETGPDGKMGLIQLAGYGIGDLYGGGSFILIGAFYMFFLTQVMHLPPSLAGLIFGLGKVWDAVSDPLMGYLSDRTRSRFGRRRLYFLIAPIPVCLSFLLMWLPVGQSGGTVQVLYYTGAYLFFSTVFTMVMVPYAAINAEITSSFHERTRLSGARMVFSQISALLSATVPMMIINRFEGGYQIMAGVFGLFYAAPWLIVFLTTREISSVREPESDDSGGMFRQFSSILRNRSFRRLAGMYVCSYTAMDMMMALMIYLLTYYLQMKSLYSAAMGSLVITQLLMLRFYVRLSNRMGKGFAFRLGLFLWLAGITGVSLLTPESPAWALILVCVVIGSGEIAGVFVPWAALPSIIDVDEMITGQKRSGTYSGAMTLIRKMVQGLIAMPLVGVLLEIAGFREGAVPEYLIPLKGMFILLPGGFILAGILISRGFAITPENHRILTEEIRRLESGGSKADASEPARRVCEKLTGCPYGSLYPVPV